MSIPFRTAVTCSAMEHVYPYCLRSLFCSGQGVCEPRKEQITACLIQPRCGLMVLTAIALPGKRRSAREEWKRSYQQLQSSARATVPTSKMIYLSWKCSPHTTVSFLQIALEQRFPRHRKLSNMTSECWPGGKANVKGTCHRQAAQGYVQAWLRGFVNAGETTRASKPISCCLVPRLWWLRQPAVTELRLGTWLHTRRSKFRGAGKDCKMAI